MKHRNDRLLPIIKRKTRDQSTGEQRPVGDYTNPRMSELWPKVDRMTAKEKYRYERCMDLNRAKIDATPHSTIRFNSGSETSQHVLVKALASYWMDQAGWTVNGEVAYEDGPIADVLAFGREDYLSYVIEVETSPPEGVQEKYLEQYVKGYPVDDLIVINAAECPMRHDDALGWVASQLPIQQ